MDVIINYVFRTQNTLSTYVLGTYRINVLET